uniref:BZIP domain-containing protein n=1 Tax=Meloidogyne hapla TaxID=6305 RepID=A0A1I8BRU7_MELHA
MQIINNQQQNESPPKIKDQKCTSSTPNIAENNQLRENIKKQQNNHHQRRTAAERRASHRRRSTAQANELVQLAQLRKGGEMNVFVGIEKRRGSQDSSNIEEIAEEQIIEENPEKSMIIDSNQQMDKSLKTSKNILTTTNSDEFPPEPTITAPGGEEVEEVVNNENICINLLEEQEATLMLFEPSPTSSSSTKTAIATNKNIPDLPSPLPFKQKYYHQRSVSDHLLNYSSPKNYFSSPSSNIQKQKQENGKKPFEDNNPQKYIFSQVL